MTIIEIFNLFNQSLSQQKIVENIHSESNFYHSIKGSKASHPALIISGAYYYLRQTKSEKNLVFVCDSHEQAAYFFNDIQNFTEKLIEENSSSIFFFPASYKKPYALTDIDNANVLSRAELLNRLNKENLTTLVITYPQALQEKVITKTQLIKNTLQLTLQEKISIEFITDLLFEYNFERVDYVYEPGQYSVRGGIVDIFSFSNDLPFRIEFFGEEVESIRSFDITTQLSVRNYNNINIIPNLQDSTIVESYESLPQFLSENTVYFFTNFGFALEQLENFFELCTKEFESINSGVKHLPPQDLYMSNVELAGQMQARKVFDFAPKNVIPVEQEILFNTEPQPSFNKNFELLIADLKSNNLKNFKTILFADTSKQIERIESILKDVSKSNNVHEYLNASVLLSLKEGFIDKDLKLAFYTDHQIFNRYYKYKLKNSFKKNKEALTLKELHGLSPGDYVSHIDHGVGKFAGLEKIDVNGKQQEAIRLIYKDNDILYVSIHSLHKIAKFSGSESSVPKINKLGSNAWAQLKQKAKKKVKELAYDLIKLYAKRKTQKGFEFMPDTYLQNELEASFIYEDTPDQEKATAAIKKDMEESFPMDRLVCGDVGFGKTEVAIRAAFKAVTDSKQVAILVPTTILALQHYKTFSERLAQFPCKVDYINRFRTAKEQKQTMLDVEAGKVDILIGTHRILSKDIKFKDLGLLVIDEEQKFGVGSKDKLKAIKSNVDTLTLTATPIPRTLQFSMMGARDLSVIATPPSNRFPVQTEIHVFNEEIIRDAISFEINRGGQVFFIHNRVQNIAEIAGMIQRLVPDAKIAIGHGQLDGDKLEEIMLGFIEGAFDVLVATTIIESGLDISNANTIIINQAQNFGMSDLHQMRGRVGRSNKKAFCYLLSPPFSVLTSDARKRLKTLEEFSDLGSGFNIALRDLDIRGAGNLLGGEQSGFITEIGFEMYMKILDEAIEELREDDLDFRETAANAITVDSRLRKIDYSLFVKDCQIDTDLELLIPSSYITNNAERLFLYKDLDDLESDTALDNFYKNLEDRFGPVPKQAAELIDTVKLRREAKKIGFEKIILKSSKMLCYFLTKADSPYFESNLFQTVLEFVKQNPAYGKFQQKNGKLTYVFEHVKSIEKAFVIVSKISEFIKYRLAYANEELKNKEVNL